MKKLGAFAVLLFCLNFVSAYRRYNTGRFGDFLDNLDPTLIVLGVIFIVSFALLNFALTRMFKGNKATAGVIALCLAFAFTYAAHSTGIDYNSLIYDFGFDLEELDNVFFLLSLVVFVFLGLKESFPMAMVVIGVIWIFIGFSDLVIDPQTFLALGFILLILGIIFVPKVKKKSKKELSNWEKLKLLAQ